MSNPSQESGPEALTRARAGADPFALFSRWFAEAQKQDLPLPEAMNLATVDRGGLPRARMVLFKGLDAQRFVFYTNYRSAKSQELEASPHAALTFWWEPPGRQVRIEGTVQRLDPAASDAYFRTRPHDSQIGAYASRQSEEVASRAQLERQYDARAQQFGDGEVPRPEFWGGYALDPMRLEFWQNCPRRLHDRILYQRTAQGAWEQTRLSP